MNRRSTIAACVVVLTACGGGERPGVGVELPPGGAEFDYQLGAAYDPRSTVRGIVARDRAAEPAEGHYSICYVNGFQTQPDERAFWLEQHPDLVLTDGSGSPVVDPEWPDEMILDISTAANRVALAAIVGGWIDGCADAGFDAVEIDNLDTFARFADRLAADDAVEYAASLSRHAHDRGVAIGQKNAAELLRERARTDFDFAIVEECNEFDECDEFIDVYGELVLVIEYDEVAFEDGCGRFPELSIVVRDVDLVAPDEPGYFRRFC